MARKKKEEEPEEEEMEEMEVMEEDTPESKPVKKRTKRVYSLIRKDGQPRNQPKKGEERAKPVYLIDKFQELDAIDQRAVTRIARNLNAQQAEFEAKAKMDIQDDTIQKTRTRLRRCPEKKVRKPKPLTKDQELNKIYVTPFLAFSSEEMEKYREKKDEANKKRDPSQPKIKLDMAKIRREIRDKWSKMDEDAKGFYVHEMEKGFGDKRKQEAAALRQKESEAKKRKRAEDKENKLAKKAAKTTKKKTPATKKKTTAAKKKTPAAKKKTTAAKKRTPATKKQTTATNKKKTAAKPKK